MHFYWFTLIHVLTKPVCVVLDQLLPFQLLMVFPLEQTRALIILLLLFSLRLSVRSYSQYHGQVKEHVGAKTRPWQNRYRLHSTVCCSRFPFFLWMISLIPQKCFYEGPEQKSSCLIIMLLFTFSITKQYYYSNPSCLNVSLAVKRIILSFRGITEICFKSADVF